MKSDEFIREVDEELQQERLAALWKRWGPLAIGVALVIVLATAAQVGWTAWNESQLQSQGEVMYAAERKLAGGQFEDAAKAYGQIASDYSGGPAAVAGLRQALALWREGDRGAAATALADLADRHGDDPLVADLAKLQALTLEADGSGDPQMIIQSLEPLAAAGRPWRYSARELQAAMAIEKGDTDLAQGLLSGLMENSATPQGVRGRARELLMALGGDPDAAAANSPDQSEAGSTEASGEATE